jgi:hypothetical protein
MINSFEMVVNGMMQSNIFWTYPVYNIFLVEILISANSLIPVPLLNYMVYC